MDSPTSRAVKLGAVLGVVLAGCAVVEALAHAAIRRLTDTRNLSGQALESAVHTDITLSGLTGGLISAALVFGLVFSPLWKPFKNDRLIAAGVAAFAILGSVFVLSGIAVLVGALSLGTMFALGTARELSPESSMKDRIGVSLGAIGAMFVACIVPTILVNLVLHLDITIGSVCIAFLATLVCARPMLWALLRAQNTASTAVAVPPIK